MLELATLRYEKLCVFSQKFYSKQTLERWSKAFYGLKQDWNLRFISRILGDWKKLWLSHNTSAHLDTTMGPKFYWVFLPCFTIEKAENILWSCKQIRILIRLLKYCGSILTRPEKMIVFLTPLGTLGGVETRTRRLIIVDFSTYI